VHFADLLEIDPQTGATGGKPLRIPGHNFRLAVGEGSVWVVAARTSGAYLFRIDPRRPLLQDRVRVGSDVSDLAVGQGGVWVTRRTDGDVVHIDPHTRRILAAIDIGNAPGSVVAGAGNVWVQTEIGNADLVRIDPSTDRVTAKRHLTLKAVQPNVLWAIGPWAPNGGLRRVDPSSLQPIGPALGFDVQPAAVAIAGRQVWIGKYLYYCSLHNPIPEGPPIVSFAWYRIDPGSLRTLSGPVFIGANLADPVVAGHSLWFAQGAYGRSLLRLDLRKAALVPASPTPGVPEPVATFASGG
jgi:hypothetical protein